MGKSSLSGEPAPVRSKPPSFRGRLFFALASRAFGKELRHDERGRSSKLFNHLDGRRFFWEHPILPQNVHDGSLKWIPPAGGEFFENRNPADTEDCIGLFPKSGPADVAPDARIAQEEIFGPVLSVLYTFSEWKSVYVDYSGRLQKAQIDTTE